MADETKKQRPDQFEGRPEVAAIGKYFEKKKELDDLKAEFAKTQDAKLNIPISNLEAELEQILKDPYLVMFLEVTQADTSKPSPFPAGSRKQSAFADWLKAERGHKGLEARQITRQAFEHLVYGNIDPTRPSRGL